MLLRFKNPLVIQLTAICAISLIMEDFRSVIVVGSMLFLSVVLSEIQERRSDKAVRSLQKLVQATPTVLRMGEGKTISLLQVVPGDIVVLSAPLVRCLIMPPFF